MTTYSLGLAQIAKDILAVLILGVGVEKLFNTARNICHYCQYSLGASTIKLLIMFSHHDELLSKVAFEKDSSKNEINAQLARSMERTDVQLAAIQVISNNELDFNEADIM